MVVPLRAVVVPSVRLATVVPSFAAALGASALVFRHLVGFSAEDSTFPLSVFVLLVALRIARIREETAKYGTRHATPPGSRRPVVHSRHLQGVIGFRRAVERSSADRRREPTLRDVPGSS